MFIMYCIFNLFSEFFRSHPQGSVVNLWKILADQRSIKELNALCFNIDYFSDMIFKLYF